MLVGHVAGGMAAKGPHDQHSSMLTYYSDSIFRTELGKQGVTPDDRAEAARIFAMGHMKGDIPDADKMYLTRLVSARTGVPQVDAENRIENAMAQEKVMMEMAHKNAAKASLFICLSLLIGAFIASAAAALGGRDRDYHYETGRFDA